MQADRTVDGLNTYYEYLLNKIENNEGLNAEESRFFKNFPKFIAQAEERAKSAKEIKHGLPEGKLKELVDRFAVQAEIYKIAYSSNLTDENLEKLHLEFGLVRCLYCNELHPKDIECLWLTLAKQHGIEINSNMTEIKGVSKLPDDSTEIDTE